jgi:hypothetical protein
MKERFLNRSLDKIPVDFDVISRERFIEIATILFSRQADHRKKMIATITFLRWRAYFFKDYQLLELTKLVDWLFLPENMTERTIVNYVQIGLRRYYGPQKQMHNISWGVWRNVADYFELFEKSEKIEHLDKACALLYPGKDFEKHVKKIASLPERVKYAIYWNWVLHINHLAFSFPYLFRKSKSGKKSSKLHLWYEFMNEWLEFKVEDFKKKDDLMAMEVLSGLNMQMKHAKKNEE